MREYDFKARVLLDGHLIMDAYMSDIPRRGETVRFDDDRYGLVTDVAWWMIGDDSPLHMVTIKVESK